MCNWSCAIHHACAAQRFRRSVLDLSPRETGFDAKSEPIGFVVDKVTLRQVLLPGVHVLSCQHHYAITEHLQAYPRRWHPFTPNDPYRTRTAPLTSKRCILCIYSTNTGTEYFKHGTYSQFFRLQNVVCFIILTYLVPVLFTFYI